MIAGILGNALSGSAQTLFEKVMENEKGCRLEPASKEKNRGESDVFLLT